MKHGNDRSIETLTTELDRAEAGADEGNPTAETLKRDIARLESDLATLGDEYETLSRSRLADEDSFRTWQPTSPREKYLRETLPGLRSSLDTLRDKLRLSEDAAAFERAAAESPVRVEASRTAAEAAEQRQAELTARADTLKQRAEALRAESASAEARAVENETRAAQAFARAVGGSDPKAERAADVVLQKARTETLSVRTKAASDALVISALEIEAGELGRQASAAEEEARGHRAEMRAAQIAGLQSEWDTAVGCLASIGTRLAKVSRDAGLPTGLWKLHIPRFSPLLPWGLTEDDLAAEFSDADLFEGVSGE
jgi:chromosome segregation ATPase